MNTISSLKPGCFHTIVLTFVTNFNLKTLDLKITNAIKPKKLVKKLREMAPKRNKLLNKLNRKKTLSMSRLNRSLLVEQLL
jgi:hypothetical protein